MVDLVKYFFRTWANLELNILYRHLLIVEDYFDFFGNLFY